jgi:oligosaccharyltransferase complex subunit alpha (ribophorin I)
MKRMTSSPSFRSLVAYLPSQSSNIYYRDQIGNISTSDIRVNRENNDLELEIQTRFPMFGGWQTQFYIGYSIPTELAVFRSADNNQYTLKVDFFTVFRDVWVEDMEIKVVLPEGCSNVKVHLPYDDVRQSETTRWCSSFCRLLLC